MQALVLILAAAASVQAQWIAHYAAIGSNGFAQSLATDAAGNIFVVAVADLTGEAETCAIKMNQQGQELGRFCFPRILSGPVRAAVDPQGNLVIAGTTESPAALPLVSALISNTGPEAGYIIKLNSQLTAIVFSTLLGGTKAGSIGAGTTLTALALDGAGNIYAAGQTLDGDFPITQGSFQTAPPVHSIPLFVTAISSAGDRILYSTLFGGANAACASATGCGDPSSASVTGLTVDAAGAVAIAGYTLGEQLPTTPGVLSTVCTCASGIPTTFVAKFSAGGSALTWATYIGSATITAMALDSSGDVIIGGQAYPGPAATSGALQATYPGGPNTQPGNVEYDSAAGFVAKLDAAADRYIFATYLGGNNLQESLSAYELLGGTNGVTGLAVDANGTIWATGGSLPSELPVPSSTPILGSTYIVGLTADGSSITGAVTAPEGGTGLGLAISLQGPVALGKTGSVLTPATGQSASFVGIASSAGLTSSGSVSPNELVSLYGAGLGPATSVSGQIVNGALTSSLGGVEVLFDGVPAPLLYAGPNQINAVVPSRIGGQISTSMEIATPAGTIAGIVLSVAPSLPEVFAYPPPGNFAVASNQDGTPNSAANPAKSGSIVTVWATGGGASTSPNADGSITGGAVYPLQLPVTVGNGFPGAVSTAPVPIIPAPQVRYSGDAPSMVKGVIQVNFQVPTLPAGYAAGPEEFYLQIGSALSDPFTIYVE